MLILLLLSALETGEGGGPPAWTSVLGDPGMRSPSPHTQWSGGILQWCFGAGRFQRCRRHVWQTAGFSRGRYKNAVSDFDNGLAGQPIPGGGFNGTDVDVYASEGADGCALRLHRIN